MPDYKFSHVYSVRFLSFQVLTSGSNNFSNCANQSGKVIKKMLGFEERLFQPFVHHMEGAPWPNPCASTAVGALTRGFVTATGAHTRALGEAGERVVVRVASGGGGR